MQEEDRESIRQLMCTILERGRVIVTTGHREYERSLMDGDAITRARLNVLEFLGLIQQPGEPFSTFDGPGGTWGEYSQQVTLVQGREDDFRSLCKR